MDVQAWGAGGLSARYYRQMGSAEQLTRLTGAAAKPAALAVPPAEISGAASSAGSTSSGSPTSSAGLIAPAAGGASATSQTLFDAQMIGQSEEPDVARGQRRRCICRGAGSRRRFFGQCDGVG